MDNHPHMDPELRATYIRLLLEKGDPELWQRANELHARREPPTTSGQIPETVERLIAQKYLEWAKSDMEL
jgi:hypothetical protein